MYIDLYDTQAPECGYLRTEWKYFNVTPQNCRRRKGSQHWTELDILLPEVKKELCFCRFNVHLHVPNVSYRDDLFPFITYTRYAVPGDSPEYGERVGVHSVFCTDDEWIGFMRLRYPRESKNSAAMRVVLTLMRNNDYRDSKTGLLHPFIDIPEPYKTRLYSGEFDEPWKPITF